MSLGRGHPFALTFQEFLPKKGRGWFCVRFLGFCVRFLGKAVLFRDFVSCLAVTVENVSWCWMELMWNLLRMITEVSIGGNDQLTNAGYVRRLRMLLREDVQLVMDPVRYPTVGSWQVPEEGLQVRDGATAYVPQALPRTMRFSETPSESAQGMAYDMGLSLELPNPDAATLAWLMAHERREWVVMWEDYNDQAWISGNEELGLRMQRSRSAAGQNILLLTLSATLLLPSFLLVSYELGQLTEVSGGGFSDGFSGGFTI